MEKISLEKMSGEKQTSPKLSLNQIRLNGKTGEFMYKHIIDGLIEKEDGKKTYKEEPVGNEVALVFLKVRRKLVEYRKDKKPLVSQEHNTRFDSITLFGNDEVEVSSNDKLREKYQNLKTQQVVYALYNNELVRVIVKGSALGSKVKAKDVYDFYSYLSSFKKDGKDEHFYEFETILYSVDEEGQLGPYKAMSFKVGKKLAEEKLKEVEEKMTIAYNHCKKIDDFYGTEKKDNKEEDKEDESSKVLEKIKTIEYPEDEISPEDSPF